MPLRAIVGFNEERECMMAAEFTCNQDILEVARRNLPQDVWDYLVGAAESETTMRRNRHALDKIAFLPRVLRDVTNVDASTTFLGHTLRIPVMLAPIGSLQAVHPAGSAASCIGAAKFGTIPMISSITLPSLEDCAASSEGPKIFQLYVRGEKPWLRDILQRVKAAGFTALALTVDSAVYGIRERQLMNNYLPPAVKEQTGRHLQSAITWELMDWIKAEWGGPFMLKGIATAADTKLAIEHGVDIIYVSNHGGRQLDHCLGAMDSLPAVVAAAEGKAKILIDGGFLRGSDVIKAVALGADAVCIGRMQGWALAAGGADGVVRCLELIEREIKSAMALIGVTSFAELNKDYVCYADVVMPSHEMSTFTHLPRRLT
jgi:isopentenyl diphosphate isomerase/L-lactate dehydrogenase-like FMN-dependent dehydrogenase